MRWGELGPGGRYRSQAGGPNSKKGPQDRMTKGTQAQVWPQPSPPLPPLPSPVHLPLFEPLSKQVPPTPPPTPPLPSLIHHPPATLKAPGQAGARSPPPPCSCPGSSSAWRVGPAGTAPLLSPHQPPSPQPGPCRGHKVSLAVAAALVEQCCRTGGQCFR